jgi:hypothetical protein
MHDVLLPRLGLPMARWLMTDPRGRATHDP